MQRTVGTTPVQLDDPTVGAREVVVIRNASGTIYLGPPGVTVATDPDTDGFPYTNTDDPLVLPTNEDGLWAVVAAGSETVEVLSL